MELNEYHTPIIFMICGRHTHIVLVIKNKISSQELISHFAEFVQYLSNFGWYFAAESIKITIASNAGDEFQKSRPS